ncbi:hypothetical protein P7C71_g6341, partial [Lecanoromycetidae sp. Uapishka_2]
MGKPRADEAGKKLRSLLRPDDTLHFFTSPYRRTRETTEGILNALTCSNPEPSPFPRHTIKVYEEPRLREQDFGNFQPDSAEMSRMWQERADYGHFFYRIPDGESAADAYDRVSGFNESLWRNFGEDDFPSVCVLVTHGLMARVFLMKWYHFSVEYFEDLRNMNHCEFVVMMLNPKNQKYVLQNQLRTWSDLKRERANSRAGEPHSPVPIRKKWEGCSDGYGTGESGDDFARRQMARRQNTAELFEDVFTADGNAYSVPKRNAPVTSQWDGEYHRGRDEKSTSQNNAATETDGVNVQMDARSARKPIFPPNMLKNLNISRDGGGSGSGTASPNHSGSENSDAEFAEHMKNLPVRSSLAMALSGEFDGEQATKDRIRADALGDQSDVEDDDEDSRTKNADTHEKSFQGAVG